MVTATRETFRADDPNAEHARIRAFGRELDELHERTRAKLGAEDIEHIESIIAWSKRFEVAGRGLLHVSLDPLTWSAGVFTLWLHKQFEAAEMAHNILHGTYDDIPGGEHISKNASPSHAGSISTAASAASIQARCFSARTAPTR